MITMETEVVKKERRNSAIPPYYILKGGNKYFIEEDLKPFLNKEECKVKLNELKKSDELDLITYRIHKHQGRYFIYKKK
jgi:hypothetical protein